MIPPHFRLRLRPQPLLMGLSGQVHDLHADPRGALLPTHPGGAAEDMEEVAELRAEGAQAQAKGDMRVCIVYINVHSLFLFSPQGVHSSSSHEEEDEDVAKERSRVMGGDAARNREEVLAVRNLTKR